MSARGCAHRAILGSRRLQRSVASLAFRFRTRDQEANVSRLDAAVKMAAIVSMLVIAAALLLVAISWRQHNIPCPTDLGKTDCYAGSAR